MTYDIGDLVPLRVIVRNGQDEPENATDASFTISRPDGTTDGPTTVTGVSGAYDLDYPPDLAGRHRWTFVATGTNECSVTGVFDVWPTDPRFIITLDDLRDELNVPETVTLNDEELRLYIAATTPVLEEIVGRVLQITLTETFDGGKTAVLLSERATSVTSVTVNGVATSSYVANLASGIVYAGTTSSPTCFTPGRQNVVVTYTAGGTTVDSNIVLAARIIAAHQYQVGQQGRSGRGRSIDETTPTRSGYAVPNRAMQLLQPSMAGRMPGFA